MAEMAFSVRDLAAAEEYFAKAKACTMGYDFDKPAQFRIARGLQKLRDPEPLRSPVVAIPVLDTENTETAKDGLTSSNASELNASTDSTDGQQEEYVTL